MNLHLWYTVFALAAAPFVAQATYGPTAAGPQSSSISYLPAANSAAGLEEYVNAATVSANGAQSITAAAEIQPSAAEANRLGQVQAQLQALNNNPSYQNLKNSEAIAESLAESNLASNIRQGKINIVAPNVVDQSLFRSLLVPSGNNNHQVIATQPLPPIIVNQPGAPPAQVSSGPPAVVKAAPVIYKIKPSVIYQQEVINKVPTPLSLNPVYVKVYKPGKKIDAPVQPAVAPVYNPAASYSAGPASVAAGADSFGVAGADTFGAAGAPGQLFASPAPYANSSPYGGAASYGNAPSYSSAPSYGNPAPYASPAPYANSAAYAPQNY